MDTPDLRELLAKATQLAEVGDFTHAVEPLQQVLAHDETNVDALLQFGRCLAMLGRVDEAVKALEKLAKLQPEDVEVFNILGHVLLNARQPDLATAAFFEGAAKAGGDAKLAANWVMGELAAKLNTEERIISSSPVSADQLGQLIARLKDGTISSKIAKQVFEACWAGEGDPDTIIEAKGLKQMSDSGELEKIVDDIIANNAPQVEDYRNSDDAKKKKKIGFFVGQAMKATQGKANPQQLNQLLREKLQ